MTEEVGFIDVGIVSIGGEIRVGVRLGDGAVTGTPSDARKLAALILNAADAIDGGLTDWNQ